MQKIKDYFKCSIANRYVALGYASLSISGIIESSNYIFSKDNFPNTSDVMLATGALLLVASRFGKETYDAYKKTQRNIAETGKIGEGFYEHITWPCPRAGVHLAIKEAGLENLLKK